MDVLEWLRENNLLKAEETIEVLAEKYALSMATVQTRVLFEQFKEVADQRTRLENGSLLGNNQVRALKCLVQHQGYPGTGWHLNGHSLTVKVLNTLVERGLAQKIGNRYRATAEGEQLTQQI